MNPNETSSPNQPPRFVEHPGRRRAWRAGQRNLAWGVAFLFAALSVLGIALFIGGARAMLPMLLCVLSFTALWVLARMKIFGQRNGVFFSLAIIALLGALAALIEQAWSHLADRTPAEPRVATNVQMPATIPAEPEIPSLIASLGLDSPDSALPRARATRDLVTTIGAKSYRIRSGDVFLFSDEKGGEITLSAGEFLARVPADAMELLAPMPAKPAADAPVADEKTALEKQMLAQALQRAQTEAARRYPALGRAGTPENRAFVDAVTDLNRRKSPMLDDPDWPIELAQSLAQRLGWKESGAFDDETPPVVEPKLAPGTRVLAEPDTPEPAPPIEPDIPPPPRVPSR